MEKTTYGTDAYNSQQTGNYKGLALEKLMISCKSIIHTGSESMCDVQDTLAKMQEKEIAEIAMTDKETFLRIAVHAWNVENTFRFYNKWLNPLHGVYQGKIDEIEQEAVEAITERDNEIKRLNWELSTIKSALSVLKEFTHTNHKAAEMVT